MILIYDFDGTLTPHGIYPQLPILNKVGSIEEFYSILSQSDKYMDDFCLVLKKYLTDHGYEYNTENISYNANTIELNPGVLDFLAYFHKKQDKQFIITASYEEYVKKTLVLPFCDGIFGTILDEVKDKVMMPERKIEVLANIINKYNPKSTEIIYLGDGYTDRFAFEYIKNRGGKSIFVYDETNPEDQETYQRLSDLNLIDIAFPKDFSLNSPLFKYITSQNKRD